MLEFHVTGLFDREDVTFNFRDKAQFLVGPNGTGKSTSLRILFYFLTGQWDRVSKLPFAGIDLVLEDRSISLARADFQQISRLRSFLSRRYRKFSARSILPPTAEGLERLLRSEPAGSRGMAPRTSIGIPENYQDLAMVVSLVENEFKDRVLFYPTYRRVEKDLGDLFDSADEWSDEEEVVLAPTIAQRFGDFGEVVGFGGQDIKKLFSEAISKIENSARQALNEHSVRFLEVIAKAKPQSTKPIRSKIAAEGEIEALMRRLRSLAPEGVDLERIESALYSLRHKLLQGRMGRLSQAEDILVIYLGELLKLTSRIDNLYADITRFLEIANSYFSSNKKIIFDELNGSMRIIDPIGLQLDFDVLSSGEKQILAIFAFLMFSEGNRGKILIIDEPELSLSVDWQKTLIEDIIRTGRPQNVFAATHSPFVIEHFSLDHVVEMGSNVVQE